MALVKMLDEGRFAQPGDVDQASGLCERAKTDQCLRVQIVTAKARRDRWCQDAC